MFDINAFEVVAFVRQVSGAVAGAAGLHGWLLFNRQHGKLSRLLEPLMIGASVVYIAAWAVAFVGDSVAQAHVGVSIYPVLSDVIRSHPVQIPLVLVLMALLVTSKHGLIKAPRLYHFLYFVVMSLLISTYAITPQLDLRQVSYVWHGWHSILTLGTVIVLDYLFFVCRNKRKLLAMLTASFDRFTILILSGLAIDMMSTYVILDEALRLNDRFFFVQTVVGILLINGILLSGPLTRRAAVYMKREHDIPKPLHVILGLAGVISLVSWNTITFLDFVPNISLSYAVLAAIYIIAIACGFAIHMVIERLPKGS